MFLLIILVLSLICFAFLYLGYLAIRICWRAFGGSVGYSDYPTESNSDIDSGFGGGGSFDGGDSGGFGGGDSGGGGSSSDF